ncbi:hypothetical protein E3P96_03805 [Wallemia ichthyophaga]|nr:hypothetical protein E3P96_03805 [Wallemia ichthyophaga]
MTSTAINKLRDEAIIPPSPYPIKAWFNTLIELVRSAQLTQSYDKEQAFVLWLRAAGVADILSKHPELRSRRDSLTSSITQYLSINVPTIIESAGTLEAILKSQLDAQLYHDQEEQLALDAVANQNTQKTSYNDNWEVIPPAIPTPSTNIPSIDPFKLYKFLSSSTFGDVSLLLLDCRPLDLYKRSRISLHPPGGKGRAGVVWIDPVSLTPHLSPATLERIIKSSSTRGHFVYSKRHLFNYTVVFDDSCQVSNLPPTLSHLLDCLMSLDDLQNPPMVLNGGFTAYQRNIGPGGVDDTASTNSNSSSSSGTVQSHQNQTPSRSMPQPDLVGKAGRSASAAPDIGKLNGVPNDSNDSNDNILPPSPSHTSQQSDYISYQPQSQTSLSRHPRSSLPTPPLPSRPPHSRRRSDQVDTEPYSGYRPRLSIDYPSVSGSIVMGGRSTPKLPAPTAQPMSPGVSGMSGVSGMTRTPNQTSTTTTSSLSTSPYKASYWHGEVVGLTGLKNLGNTCYMNSTLQCLSATVPFARFFTSGLWRRCVNHSNRLGMQGRLAESFSQILSHMWREQFTFISPMTFRSIICTFARQFHNTDQHDAQEFLSFLLDGLHEDLKVGSSVGGNSVDSQSHNAAALETLPTPLGSEREWRRYKTLNDSIIVDYFQGQFRNRMECLSCHKTSTTYNAFMYLSLPVPARRLKGSVSLTACLDAFLKDEIMEKDNAWRCPNCKVARRSVKRLSIARLPPVLLIQLKRFAYAGPFCDKVETNVAFPLRGLDLTPYTPQIQSRSHVQPFTSQNQYQHGASDDVKNNPTSQIPPFKYDLYAVTNHFGSLQSGHYTANVRSGQDWFSCQDSRVGELSEKDVVSKHGYMLYYKRSPSTNREMEQQNDESMEGLTDKLRRLRGATSDIYDQSESQIQGMMGSVGV